MALWPGGGEGMAARPGEERGVTGPPSLLPGLGLLLSEMESHAGLLAREYLYRTYVSKELLSVLCKGAKVEAGKAVKACSGEVMLVAWSREQNLRGSWSDLCFLPVDSKRGTYLLHLWGCSASRCAWHILIQGILDD